ncbi:MAG: LPS export ABC transporter periplasmic protein LptC, partial [bacterium]|nr:LPS export ABC transporter periplasmic protein LptC [bacterium]
HRTFFKVLLALVIVATVVVIFSGIRGKSGPAYTPSDAEGEQMVFALYNEANKKTIELKCKETQKGDDDRLYMKKVEALIFKKGRMNKNIRAFGDQGYIENDDHNFFLEKNARIVSEDFTVNSESFNLKDRADLSSAPQVKYRTKSLKGSASGGMMFHLNVNTLKFFDTRGIYEREDKRFNYKAGTLWLIDKEKIMLLQDDAVIRDDTSILRSNWVTVKFDADFKKIQETSSQKGSYLYIVDIEKNESKEVKADYIRSLYDEDGHLTELSMFTQAQVLLKDNANHTTIASNQIDMYFDGPTGLTKRANIPGRGVVENVGKTRFRVESDTIDMKYDDKGQIRLCKGVGNSKFVVRKYHGNTDDISYNLEKNTIRLNGENTKLLNNANTFYSSTFKVEIEKNILSSKAGVKSVIRLEKDSVLFSKNPIFINAREFIIDEGKNTFVYKRFVTLTQGDIVMEAMDLEITDDNHIEATGRASLTFKSNDKEVAIKGGKLVFDPKTKTISIDNNGTIKNDENILRASDFVVRFNDQNEVDVISGKDNVYFSKEEITGTSDRVEWRFREDIMVLKGSPQIKNSDGGKTSGKELKINLKTGTISILSSRSGRTETIIR